MIPLVCSVQQELLIDQKGGQFALCGRSRRACQFGPGEQGARFPKVPDRKSRAQHCRRLHRNRFLIECTDRSGGNVMTRQHRPGILACAVMFALSLGIGSVLAAGDPEPPPAPEGQTKPPKDGGKKKSEQEFRANYRAAYVTIYERNDYARAIRQLRALDHDDRAEVANLIGYSYRKLGDYRLAQVWYERALKADPTHVKTWQYYGLWQIEQGHPERAQAHLARIEQLCGAGCAEYRSLAAALDATAGDARRTY
jgi:TolA-binding protein